jgi:uncharacterized surface protein with fasciclin (FAS1) repeats
MKKKVFGSAAGLALFLLVLAPVDARFPRQDSTEPREAVDVPKRPIARPALYPLAAQAEKTSDTQMMSAAIKASGLEEALSTRGPFTLLAPSDEAFGSIPKEQLDALFGDPVRLRAFVLKHLVSGKLSSKDLAFLDAVPEVLGGEYAVAVRGRSLVIGEARLLDRDLQASNGTLHVIDRLLVPVA